MWVGVWPFTVIGASPSETNLTFSSVSSTEDGWLCGNSKGKLLHFRRVNGDDKHGAGWQAIGAANTTQLG